MPDSHPNKKFIIDTDQAPRAIGPHSQAVGYGGLLFVSGQLPTNPDTGEVSQGGIETQTRRCMDNLQAVLMAAGLDFSHVLKTSLYLRNMNDLQLATDVYGLYFDHAPPARTVLEVSRLPRDVLVCVEAIAAAPTDYEARIEGDDEDNAHPGPDEWEAKHKEEASAALEEATPPATPNDADPPELPEEDLEDEDVELEDDALEQAEPPGPPGTLPATPTAQRPLSGVKIPKLKPPMPDSKVGDEQD